MNVEEKRRRGEAKKKEMKIEAKKKGEAKEKKSEASRSEDA
ncbi:MAG: hypothetical protein U0270_00645 [Labilithrix sp.]